MERSLSFALHVLTARLDRVGDRMLRAEHGISHSRFLTLVLIGRLGTSTQRGLAEALGVTEPSVSRMTAVLAAEGLLGVEPDPGGGHRKRLSLTEEGRRVLDEVQGKFEERFAVLVDSAGVPYDEYLRQTQRLLDALDRFEQGEAT